MGKRSEFPRITKDAYQTIDPRAVQALAPYLDGIRTFAEPCCGEGELIKQLEKHGLICVWASDIEGGGMDALHFYRGLSPEADCIITNPPWSRTILHLMIEHFMTVLPTWLLFDSDWANNKHAGKYLPHCSHIVAIGRLKWIPRTTMVGKDNCSWYRFDINHTEGPRFYGRSTHEHG